MEIRTATKLLLAILCLGSLPLVPAHAQEKLPLKLTLTSDGDSVIQHVVDRPLMIQVTLSNARSMNALLAQIASVSEQTKRSKDDPPQNTPQVSSISLGSSNQPIVSLIQFSVSTDGGKHRSPINLHPLALYKELPSQIALDGRNAFRCTYGLEPGRLNDTAGGVMTLFATLDKSITNVELADEPLSIQVVAEERLDQLEKIRLDNLSAEYYIRDEKFARAQVYADRLDKTVPQYAAVIRAEMYLGLKDYVKARKNCMLALKLYKENTRDDSSPEPPLSLFALLQDIEDKRVAEK